MSPVQANNLFFALQDSVWDVADMTSSRIGSDETNALPPPRNWLGINDVYLVT
jgi:hypothetical protein